MHIRKSKMKETQFPKFLDIKEVADILGISKSQVYKEVERGNFKAIRIGNRYKIFANEVYKFIMSHTYIGFNNANKNSDILRQKRIYDKSEKWLSKCNLSWLVSIYFLS